MNKISPSLSIYKFPITAISSITNRVSGIYLTGIMGMTAFYYLLNKQQKESVLSYYHNLELLPQKMINYSILYPFGYHVMGGVRHLIWDSFPHLLSNSKVAKSSYALFGLSIIPTILLEKKISDNQK